MTEVEGYPGVVVHGPYTMQQLLNFVADMNPTETLRSFEMKALQPLYVDQPVRLCGKPSEGGKGCEVWAVSPNGVSQVQLLSSRLSRLAMSEKAASVCTDHRTRGQRYLRVSAGKPNREDDQECSLLCPPQPQTPPAAPLRRYQEAS